ncbi:hypothetical protein [Streptomyces sp. NPDC051214]
MSASSCLVGGVTSACGACVRGGEKTFGEDAEQRPDLLCVAETRSAGV